MKVKFKRLALIYRNIKLKQKFIILLFAWLIPVIFVSFYIYLSITARLIESQLVLARQGYQQVESFFNYRFERILLASSLIAMDSNLNDILKKDPATYSLNEQVKDLSAIHSYLNQFQSGDNNLDTLRLYVPGGFEYASEDKLLFNLDEARDTLWFKNSFKGWGWVTCNPPEYVENQNSIAIVRPIRDLEHYRHLISAVRIDIDLDEIEQILSRINLSQGCLSYMTTSEGMLAGISSYELMDTLRLSDEDLKKALSAKDGFIKLDIMGHSVWTCAHYLQNIDLILVTVLPEKELAEEIHFIQLYYILALSLLVSMFILTIIPTINSITGRIKQLVNRMKLVQEGNLNANLYSKQRDEIGLLVDDFNFMLERINELMKQQYMLGQDLKTAELKALQSQINPHFLYNTLEMIGWLAAKGDSEKIQSVVNTLAQFFRLSLNRGNDITSIGNEIKLVESYLFIQRTRFQNDLTLEINMKDIDEYSIPKITLQPVVENAIIHGILEKESKSGTIKINGSLKKNNMIELTVEDNGVGMSKTRIRELMNGQYESHKIDGYGLKNIEMRICLFFNIGKAIHIKSQPGIGTRVTISIPAIPYYDTFNNL